MLVCYKMGTIKHRNTHTQTHTHTYTYTHTDTSWWISLLNTLLLCVCFIRLEAFVCVCVCVCTVVGLSFPSNVYSSALITVNYVNNILLGSYTTNVTHTHTHTHTHTVRSVSAANISAHYFNQLLENQTKNTFSDPVRLLWSIICAQTSSTPGAAAHLWSQFAH